MTRKTREIITKVFAAIFIVALLAGLVGSSVMLLL